MDVCIACGTRRCTTSIPARWCDVLNGWLAAVLDDLGVLEPDRHANQLYLQAMGCRISPAQAWAACDRTGRGGCVAGHPRAGASRMRPARARGGPAGLTRSTTSVGRRVMDHARRGRPPATGGLTRSLPLTSASYFPSSDPPSDLPAFATTLRMKSY
jgi:hypothetical protein